MKLGFHFFLLFSALLASTTASAAKSCNGFYLAASTNQKISDLVISQTDPRFGAHGLLDTNDSSSLCGMTSLANLINVNLAKEGRALAAEKLIDFVAEKSLDFQEEQREKGERRFSVMGMYPISLEALSKNLLKKTRLKLKVDLRSDLLADKEIRPQDLETSAGSIWALEFILKGSEDEVNSGHFIYVISYDPAQKVADFVDPLEPQVVKSATVVQNGPDFQLVPRPGTHMDNISGKGIEGYFRLKAVLRFLK